MSTIKKKLIPLKSNKISVSKTRKHSKSNINKKYIRNRIIIVKNNDDGWFRITIRGAPYERGVSHGKQLVAANPEIFTRMFSVYDFLFREGYGRDIEFFYGLCDDFYRGIIKRRFPKIFREMEGIAAGAGLDVRQVILVNVYMSIPYFYAHMLRYIDTPKFRRKYADVIRDELAISANPAALSARAARLDEFKDRCSLVMAVGKGWTKDGGIVCGHASFSNFLDAQFCNVILRIEPAAGDGYAMVMQTAPGGIWSMTDFFVTSAGIVGSETTIRGFNAFALRDPICCRIRECMQYSKTLEDYAERLQKRNSGDYACSWMFGDVGGKPRIMRVELGLNYVNVETTRDGVFLGFNSAYDERIRNIECSSSMSDKANHATESGMIDGASGWRDVSSSIGNRRVQLEKLTEKYRGRIDTEVMKRILADHYDNHLGKTAANTRTVCKHGYESGAGVDGGEGGAGSSSASAPHKPVGAYDTKIADSALAKRMSFLAHWGPPCGTPFSVKEHMKKHPEWKDWAEHLVDFPRRGWVDV
jgi:hypothetical protein